MKKIFFYIILVLSILILISCGYDDEKALGQDDIMERVKEYHLVRFKLSSLITSYDEYKNIADSMLSSKYPREEDTFFMVDGTAYTEEKLASLSKEEIKALRERLYAWIKSTLGEIDYEPFFISKVYDHSTLNFKYVFVKSPQTINLLGNRIIYTRYTLHNDMGEWRILEITGNSWGQARDGEQEKARIESFGGEPIDFVIEGRYPDFLEE